MDLDSETARLPKGKIRRPSKGHRRRLLVARRMLYQTVEGQAMFRNSSSRGARRGTTAVEAAFILPVFLTFVFSLIEYGHAQMVSNLLKCACRNAARQGSTDGFSSSAAKDRVTEYLNAAINTSTLNVVVKNASVWDTGGTLPTTNAGFNALPDIELNSTSPRQLFLVRATVNYSNVSLISMPFLNGVTLSGQAFMRHE